MQSSSSIVPNKCDHLVPLNSWIRNQSAIHAHDKQKQLLLLGLGSNSFFLFTPTSSAWLDQYPSQVYAGSHNYRDIPSKLYLLPLSF